MDMPQVTPTQPVDPAAQAQAKAQLAILMQQYGLGEGGEPSPEEQHKFLGGYSWGAAIFSFFYYWAMSDWLFVFLSLFVSVIFIFLPILLIMPIFARRRAYEKKNWGSFRDFQNNQKTWDKSGLYLLITSLVLGLIAFALIGPMLKNSIQQVTGDQSGQGVIDQLNNAKDQYQNILGN